METHPVPQNVTSFEFHLIGDMTLRQFIYLAIGVTTAYLTYVFAFEAAPYVAVPIILISASLGAAYAFLPIQDRPLDHWTGAFFRAVYSPTKREWKVIPGKNQAEVNQEALYQNRLQVYFSQINRPQVQTPIQTVATPAPSPTAAPVQAPAAASQAVPEVQTIAVPAAPSPTAAPTNTKPVFNEDLLKTHPSPHAPKVDIPLVQPAMNTKSFIPTDDKLRRTVELAKQSQLIQMQIVQTEKQMNYLKQMSSQPGANPTTYAGDLQKVFDNLQTLIKSAQDISNQLAELNRSQNHSNSAPVQVKEVETAKPKKALPSLTSSPNVINGIVTDAASNYLENVVVVIHNQDGLPVRALKTNKLGQFTGATPLPSGTYTLSLEKYNLEFDVLKITLEDKVLPALEVSAKKGETVTG